MIDHAHVSVRERLLHIGIVACSFEGAALCYRSVCLQAAEALGAHAHPRISLDSHPMADYVPLFDRDDWKGVARLLAAGERRVVASGADFVVCPDNTCHQAFPDLLPVATVPWLHIGDVVTAEADRLGCTRLGVMGTRSLMESTVYQDRVARRGIELLVPQEAERMTIDRIIYDELVRGCVDPTSRLALRRIAMRLVREGCDGVVLGCTELPLALEPDDAPVPLLDSTRLLAGAALARAMSSAVPVAVRPGVMS